MIAAHVLAVLVLARLVRPGPDSLGGNVSARAAFAYGLPFVGAAASYLRWPLRPSPRSGSRILCCAATAAICIIGHWLSLVTLQQTDMTLTVRYLAAMQTQLDADARFRKVRLGSYSCDYILFPYLTIHGDVATEQDHRDLKRLVWSLRAPVYRSVNVVTIAGRWPTRTQ
jgi:hypothetical protein